MVDEELLEFEIELVRWLKRNDPVNELPIEERLQRIHQNVMATVDVTPGIEAAAPKPDTNSLSF